MEIVTVRVARPEASQVVLWERHPGHPAGEVFLAGEGLFEVALTPAVKARLQDGRLVAVENAKAEGKSVAAVAVEPAATAPAAEAPEVDAAEPEPAKPRKRAARKGGL